MRAKGCSWHEECALRHLLGALVSVVHDEDIEDRANLFLHLLLHTAKQQRTAFLGAIEDMTAAKLHAPELPPKLGTAEVLWMHQCGVFHTHRSGRRVQLTTLHLNPAHYKRHPSLL